MCLAGSESLFPLLYHLTLESCLGALSHSCMTREASGRCLHRNWQSPLGPGDLILSWDWREWIVVYCTSCSCPHCPRPSENRFQTPWEILLLHCLQANPSHGNRRPILHVACSNSYTLGNAWARKKRRKRKKGERTEGRKSKELQQKEHLTGWMFFLAHCCPAAQQFSDCTAVHMCASTQSHAWGLECVSICSNP